MQHRGLFSFVPPGLHLRRAHTAGENRPRTPNRRHARQPIRIFVAYATSFRMGWQFDDGLTEISLTNLRPRCGVAQKAPEHWRTPRGFAWFASHPQTLCVMDCGGPPPLFAQRALVP